ncbi:MAG: hypothetical protein P0Y49_02525 [Candidatus Pedobacter colombiensis]|uniref:DUF4397 domain-containing protein n=1 Tax=Candidatus Pedobacter colombiensis TaxID=3121371 RepID=A0AAJ6B6J1_9SPHI|nr:hypothetical protein [Pedobacter sp.]WEK20027.1 MAG: hypothetical protein P0Y49_02525 [Pedobacter sp.]
MKNAWILVFAVCFAACKKDAEVFKTSSSINVINAAVDLGGLKVNPAGKAYSFAKTTDQVLYGANRFYYAELGYKALIAVPTADTTKLLFNESHHMESGFYTLYISGTAAKVESMLLKEVDFPFIKTDVTTPASANFVTNVRFVNLSPNSPAVKIKIKNNAVNEVDNLAYKGISNWNRYTNKATATTPYIFEVRDASSDALLFSYTFNATVTNRFKNVALIIKGLVGTSTGVNAFGIFVVNYF